MKIKPLAQNATDSMKKKAGFSLFRKITPTWAKQMDEDFSCDTLEGDNIKGKAGDYLCIGEHNEMWPVKKDIFEKTYRAVNTTEPTEEV